jgi:hypothetical protein
VKTTKKPEPKLKPMPIAKLICIFLIPIVGTPWSIVKYRQYRQVGYAKISRTQWAGIALFFAVIGVAVIILINKLLHVVLKWLGV